MMTGREQSPGWALAHGAPLAVDCVRCPVAGPGCAGCMVTALLDADRGHEDLERASQVPLDVQERAAVRLLLDRGVITAQEAGQATATRVPLPLHGVRSRAADSVAG
jgi:hypothetical protein